MRTRGALLVFAGLISIVTLLAGIAFGAKRAVNALFFSNPDYALKTIDVTTDGSGNATFTANLVTYRISYFGGTGNDLVLTVLQSPYIVTNTNDSGAGSLRQAILDANANSGADTINFNITGGGVQTIAPTSALPAVSEAREVVSRLSTSPLAAMS